MRIRIRARDVRVTRALRAHVELRLAFALSRFGAQVGQVAVHLSTSDERRDRAESLCRIWVRLPRAVKVQETDKDLFAAVDRAASRVARSVAHAIEHDRTLSYSLAQPGKEKRPRPGPPAVAARRTTSPAADKVKRRPTPALRRKSPRRQGA